ncbi:MAG: NCS2 family nucleobase:cation symporter [Bifidobacteriaceae bacterium]|jgi:uracil-xanthine permease|nr:NCS2 family nucleobase:cation symporter [Bifidobacteriaceae bacterium]
MTSADKRGIFNWEKVSFNEVSVVAPNQRLSWGKTVGLGLQHIVAMFGATFLVPLVTGFPPATTLFFSAIATALFLTVTKNRVPSYLGSSFAFIAPITAATATTGNIGAASFGILCTGMLLALVGVAVHFAGAKWIDIVMPPVVTGSIVALIGLNLAPAAWNNFKQFPATAAVTLVAIVLIGALFRNNILGKLSILLGVIIGYVFAVTQGEVDFSAIDAKAWIGFPDFTAPTPNFGVLIMFLPVVLVLIAENVGHVKSVAVMTGKNLDNQAGKALFADGLGTVLAGFGGGSGTTTYAENIGVMAVTKVYSTAAYWIAAGGALILSLCPKFGALIATIPVGVLGGASTLLYGMIGMLGVRIWVENKVDFSASENVTVAAISLIIGIADFTFIAGDVTIGGITIGSFVCIALYHLLRLVGRWLVNNE